MQISTGLGCSWGPDQGRIKPMPMTSAKTEDGKIWLYGRVERFTEDVIPAKYFGCADAAEIKNLEEKLNIIGKTRYRHHVSAAPCIDSPR